MGDLSIVPLVAAWLAEPDTRWREAVRLVADLAGQRASVLAVDSWLASSLRGICAFDLAGPRTAARWTSLGDAMASDTSNCNYVSPFWRQAAR